MDLGGWPRHVGLDQYEREVAPTPYSLAYLQTKKEKMGHALSLRENEGAELSHFGAPGSTVPIIKSAGMLHLVSELKEQLFPVSARVHLAYALVLRLRHTGLGFANFAREVGRAEKRTISCVFASRVVSGRW